MGLSFDYWVNILTIYLTKKKKKLEELETLSKLIWGLIVSIQNVELETSLNINVYIYIYCGGERPSGLKSIIYVYVGPKAQPEDPR